MPVRKTKKTTTKALTISLQDFPVLDIAHATTFASFLKKNYKKNADIFVDAQHVSRITTPCVQLLISLANTSTSNKQHFSLTPSEALREAFSALGLIDLLNQWSPST